jgi:hypothetical protein
VIASEGVGRFVGDRYHIVRELGRGGMGVVYLGHDLRRDMDVAIKFRGVTHHDATLWLKREFRSVASMRHPNLVELYELVAHEEACYFTMEYLPGVDPRRWVERPRATAAQIAVQTGPTLSAIPVQDAGTEMTLPPMAPALPSRELGEIDFARVRMVLAQLAEGLAFLHARGVIHRDVKPSNTLVMPSGAIKLLDFGLALERRRAADELAREARVVGTAAYLAPEYVERMAVSPAMDIYALGVLGYELVTGAPPFGGTMHLLARLGKTLAPARASTINKSVPADLDDLLEAMLSPDPLRRPTALQVAVRITGELSYPRAVRRPTRFVGRQLELAQLDARLADPTPRGRLVMVTGASGVGKTALVDEALSRARDEADLVWRGRCHERERVPYRAFDFVIDDLATELAGNPQLASAIDHSAALGRVFPALGARLEGNGAEAASDLRVERERALAAMVQLFDHVLAGARRSIVVVDDLQWADDDSLDLLGLLVVRVARPLTIVATWTVEGELPEPLRVLLERVGAAGHRLELAPMAGGELAEILAELAPDASGERLKAAAEMAAGSPYLAELIGRELADAGLADPQDAEQRRFGRLDDHERAVAEITALAGASATFEQLRVLAELPSAQLQSALRALEDGRVVRASPSASGDPVYTFYHQRLRTAAHAAIELDRRRTLHARFADVIEREHGTPDQIAYHAEHAGQLERAARWAETAGDSARNQLAWALAADWYGRAGKLEQRPPGHEGAPDGTLLLLRAKRAEMLFLAGKLADAAREFEELARASRDGDRWRVRAAESYLKLGELDIALATLDDVLARRGHPRARSRAASALRAASVAARWVLPRRGGGEVDAVVASAYRAIASFLSTPYPIEAFEYVLRGIDVAERAGDRGAHAMGMAMLSAYLCTGSLGRFGDRAIATAQRLAVQSDSPYARMVSAGAAGIVAALRGDWTGMRAAHEEGERICRRIGLERSWEASFLRAYWALGEYYAGDAARAVAMLDELEGKSDDLISRALIGSYRGLALVATGDLVRARALYAELERSPAAHRGLAAIYRQVFAGDLALAERDYARAAQIGRTLARTARAEWLAAMPAVSAMIDVLAARAELGLGDAKSARRRARALYRRGKHSFYAATAVRLWAEADAQLGERTIALAHAREVAARRGGLADRLALDQIT